MDAEHQEREEMENEAAWQSELHNLFGDVSDDDDPKDMPASAATKRMERLPAKEDGQRKKIKDQHYAIDEEENMHQPSMVDVMASLTLMRKENQQHQKAMKKRYGKDMYDGAYRRKKGPKKVSNTLYSES